MRFQGLGLCCTVLAICFPALAQGDDLTLAINMANQARAAQGLQPLAWNPDLAAWARVWANEIAAGQVPFSHAEGSMRPQQGENLFEQQSTQCDIAYSTPLQTAMQSWLAQASLYTNSPVTGSEPWLHWGNLLPSVGRHGLWLTALQLSSCGRLLPR